MYSVQLRAILPVDAVAVAALVTLHLLRLPRHVLALVTAGAHEMRLGHHAPRLRAILADLHVILGNPHFYLVHVQHDPRLPVLLDDAVPAAPAQSFLLGAVAAAPGPSHVSHSITPAPRLSLPARARGLPPAGPPSTSFPRT